MLPAIQVDHLSKHYRIRANARAAMNLQENLVHGLRTAWRRFTGRSEHDRDFWALKDVSFRVNPGEVLGIIGRNGAGKSTLLKLLSRVTEPTSGRAEIRGRLGSLLEVGTGFHPELSGRENVFLNGSLLGMSRAEIRRKFDAIVAFADIGDFLDTPVKRYSSGMNVRLAFAIASHLEPEILVLDEVLAVGDAAFQKKCLNKVQDVSHDGRTILFVSHDMAAIRRLCNRALWLEKGEIVAAGEAASVVNRYLGETVRLSSLAQPIDLTNSPRFGSRDAVFSRVVCSAESPESPVLTSGGRLNVELTIQSSVTQRVDSISVILFDQSGAKLVNADTIRLDRPVLLQPGENTVRIRIDPIPLNPGVYVLGLFMARRPLTVFDYIDRVCELEIAPSPHDDRPAPNEDGRVLCHYEMITPEAG